MPTRMIRDWTDSLKLDGISADAERLFLRLIMKADDYGRFHSDPRLIKAHCFPLIDNLRPNDLTRWLDELSTRQLILRYEADGRSCLAIVNYGQRLKQSKAKFPQMPGTHAEWLPTSEHFREVPGSSGKFPLEEKGREIEVEGEGKESPPPKILDFEKQPEAKPNPNRVATFEQVMAFAKGQPMPITQECCEAFFDRMEAEGWVTPRGLPLADWRARFRSWVTNWTNNANGRKAVAK